LSGVFHELANQKGCKIIKGSMVQDHVHMIISIPPKYSVAEIVGYIKGKSAIAVARQFGGRKGILTVRDSGREGMQFQL
jgi:putative transposase